MSDSGAFTGLPREGKLVYGDSFNADLRRGSLDELAQSPYLFPFDAWTFQDPAVEATPDLTLTSPWNLVVAGTMSVTGVITFTATPIVSALTASLPVFTNGTKALVSNVMTGTGNVVMSIAPALTGITTAAAITLSGNLILSNTTASRPLFTDGSKVAVSNAMVGTGDVVMSVSPVLTGTVTAAAATLSGNLTVSNLTASEAVFSNESDVLVSNALTGTGNVVMSASPVLTGTITAAAANFSGAVGVDGNFDVGNTKFTVSVASGDALVAGELEVTGGVTLSSSLDVTGTVSVASILQHIGDTDTHITFTANTITSDVGATGDHLIQVAGSTIGKWNEGGLRVGDGTDPEAKLDVIDSDSTAYAGGHSEGQSDAGATLFVHNLDNTANAFSQVLFTNRDDGAGRVRLTAISIGTGQSEFAIGVEPGHSMAEAFRIDSLGNVGIGVADPVAKLDVRDDDATVYSSTDSEGQYANGATLFIQNLNATANAFSQVLFTNRAGSVGRVRLVAIGPSANNSEFAIGIEKDGGMHETIRVSYRNVDIYGSLTLGIPSVLDGIINSPHSMALNIDSDASDSSGGVDSIIFGADRAGFSGGTEIARFQSNGSIGIGTSSPNASALLDLSSTTGALLLPRMTTDQRNALSASSGMLIYNSTLNKLQGYEPSGWRDL